MVITTHYLKLPLVDPAAIPLRCDAPVATGSVVTSNLIGLSAVGIGGKGGRMGEETPEIMSVFNISLP